MNRARLVVLMIVLAATAGCGKKGSLYLPNPPPANAGGVPATAPTASSEPAAPAATLPPAP